MRAWFAALCWVLALSPVSVLAEPKPYYDSYAFDTPAGSTDFAPIITAIPAALLAETLRRDRILGQALGNQFRYHPLDKGPDAVKLMTEGKIDVTMQSDITMLEMLSRLDIVNIGLYKENFGVVVGPRGNTQDSLRGKRIGTPGGGAGHFTLLQWLDQAGMKESDVILVRMDVRDMPEALLSGRIEAFSSFEPAPSAILSRHSNRFSALYRHRAPGYLIVTRKLLRENPEAARQIAAALARAVRWLRKDRANLRLASQWALQAMRTFQGPQLTEKEIIRMTRSDLLDLRDVPQIARTDAQDNSLIARNFAFMKKHGKLPPALEWKSVQDSFDFSLMKEILARARHYRLDEFDYAR